MLISPALTPLLMSRQADIALWSQSRRLFDNRKLAAADGSVREMRPLAVQRDNSGATGRDREATDSPTEGCS
jgi:hypothetical protein